MRIKIKENSLLAKIAAKNLHYDSVAMTIGRTIYVYGVSKDHILADKTWLRHELKHVEQCLRLGVFWFLVLYILESIRHGYQNNKFEIEARAAEQSPSILENFVK